jgi:pantetheine-phosphate adenylyltransferase
MAAQPGTNGAETSAEKIGLYPASFDPLTVAHVGIAERAATDFDRLIVAAAINPKKKYEFDMDEKLAFLEASLGHIPNVEVTGFDSGLTVDHARRLGARWMIRGSRSVTDFLEEQELAAQNVFVQEAVGIKRGDPGFVDTQTFYAESSQDHISSSLVRGLMSFRDVEHREERIRPLVPEPVFEVILAHLEASEAEEAAAEQAATAGQPS